MIGIYSITNTVNGKRYIGKSINLKARWYQHKWSIKCGNKGKDTNRHLFNAVKKYGIDAFKFEVLTTFPTVCEKSLFEAELFYIDKYRTTERDFGYNLRRDSSTKCIVHEETKAIQSAQNSGENNPNYGKSWTEEMKKSMSEIAKSRHSSGEFYGDVWKEKLSVASKKLWSDEDKKKGMAEKVRSKKLKYDFYQYTKDGVLVQIWPDVKSILEKNPTYKWQNIYSACNGYKPTYMGFVWKKVLKNA